MDETGAPRRRKKKKPRKSERPWFVRTFEEAGERHKTYASIAAAAHALAAQFVMKHGLRSDEFKITGVLWKNNGNFFIVSVMYQSSEELE
jgi:hypothetical protein